MIKYTLTFLFFICSGFAADFDKAAKEIELDLVKSNQLLDNQRTRLFKQRQKLVREIKTEEVSLENNAKSVSKMEKEIEALLEEIKSTGKAITLKENEFNTVKSQLRDVRRNLEAVLPSVYGDSMKQFFVKQDKVQKSGDTQTFSKLLWSFRDRVLHEGFGSTVYKVSGVSLDGTVKAMELISLSHARYFLKGEAAAGVLQGLGNSIHPELVAHPGLKPKLDSLQSGEEATLPIDFTGGLATKQEFKSKSVLEHFAAGGVIIYPLVFLGFLCLLAGLYKTLQLYSIRSRYDDKVVHLLTLLNEGKSEEAHSYVKGLKDPIRSLLSEALKHKDVSRENLEEHLNENILSHLPKLDRFLTVLSVSAGAAPLLGLLGTVMGI
ncbi:MAG: MotA/TolQ/ExbB proton channel family protein, partial [Lentisphaeraceae bacterium]|nr:MotA/TolQ/ExbB proton channel family protein [Lentisphaeraceae bacterium]